MIYPQRDQQGTIIGFSSHPNQLTDATPIEKDSVEFLAFLAQELEESVNVFDQMTKEETDNFVDFLATSNVLSNARRNAIKAKHKK